MPDYAGPLQRVILSQTLWLVVAAPLCGLVLHLTVARSFTWARRVGLASTSLAALATAACAVQIALAPGNPRALSERIAGGVRIGRLEAALELLFDPLAALACALACVVALAAAVFLASRAPTQRGWRVWAWLDLALSGALLSFVAGGFPAMALGWTLAAGAGAWLAGWTDAHAGVVDGTRRAFGVVALLTAGWLLFWGLGGDWQGDEYARERQAQFATARAGAWPESGDVPPPEALDEGAKGSLTLTSAPGALVFLDDSRTPSMRAPFVAAPVTAGAHVLRIHPGDAADDAVIGPVAVASGEDVMLVPIGPTLSFRDIAAQLAVRDRYGEATVRRALEARTALAGLGVLTLAIVALLAAAAVTSASSASAGAPLALAATAYEVTTTALGPYVLARLVFLLPGAQSPALPVLLFASAALVSVVVAAVRLRRRRARGGPPPDGLATALFERVPARAGVLLLAFERWVIDAVAGSAHTLAAVAAWVAARADLHLLGAPADAVAARAARAGRGAELVLGVPLSRLVWVLVTLAALAALAHAARSGR